MIRVIGLGSRRGAKKGLVQAADAAAAGVPVPAVVAAVRISVKVADKSCSARFLWREHRVKCKQPEPSCLFEVGIERQRLDLSAPDQIVARAVADLGVVDDLLLLARADILTLTVKKTKIVIVALDRAGTRCSR
jgi:hypothetical protein